MLSNILSWVELHVWLKSLRVPFTQSISEKIPVLLRLYNYHDATSAVAFYNFYEATSAMILEHHEKNTAEVFVRNFNKNQVFKKWLQR